MITAKGNVMPNRTLNIQFNNFLEWLLLYCFMLITHKLIWQKWSQRHYFVMFLIMSVSSCNNETALAKNKRDQSAKTARS